MIKRIKDVITYIGSGTTPKSGNPKYYDDALIPWLNSGDLNNSLVTSTAKYISEIAMQDYPSLRFYPKGSVVVAMYGASIGKTGILNFQTTVNQACCVLTPDESQISSNFLHLLLQLSKEKFLLESFGGTQPNISQKVVANLLIDVPSLEKQNMITSYLDKECEKISHNIELLERKADAYKRLRRSIINRAVTRGLNTDAPLKLSGIPWIDSIPAHWDIKRGKSIFQEVYRAVRPQDGIVTCFRNGEVTLRTNRRTTGFTESEKEIGYHGVRVGDLVIHQMDAFAGSIGISDSDGKCSPICIVCRPLHEDEADLGYYCQLLRVMAHSGFIQSLAKGIRERTTDFRYKTLVTLDFPVPPYIEQQQITAYLDDKCGKIDTIIEKIVSKIERLKELKRSLINETVTGKRAI